MRVAAAGGLPDVPAVHGDLERRGGHQQRGVEAEVADAIHVAGVAGRRPRTEQRAGLLAQRLHPGGRVRDRLHLAPGPQAASVNASSASSMWASRRPSVQPAHGVGRSRSSGRTSASSTRV